MEVGLHAFLTLTIDCVNSQLNSPFQGTFRSVREVQVTCCDAKWRSEFGLWWKCSCVLKKCERLFYNHKGENWVQKETALFWVITQRVVIIAYRRSVQPIGSIFREEPLKIEPIGRQERSVRNYHYSLLNNPEERSSHLLSSRSLKSRLN